MVGSWLLSMLGLDGVTELFNFTHVGTKELSMFSVLECITYWHFHKEVEGILQVSVNAIFHACKFISYPGKSIQDYTWHQSIPSAPVFEVW